MGYHRKQTKDKILDQINCSNNNIVNGAAFGSHDNGSRRNKANISTKGYN